MKLIFIAGTMLVLVTAAASLRVSKKTGGQPLAGFALLELFTSEGCSSCPPADEALIRLSKEYGDHLYVVGFHVDYWNNLGWKDAFSDKAYSVRQEEYAGHFGLESVYTPQVVINGEQQLVGGDEAGIRRLLEEELKKNPLQGFDLGASMQDQSTVLIMYKTIPDPGVSLNLAIVQRYAETHVRAGENAGKSLRHINIVRSLTALDPLKEGGKASFSLPPGLAGKDCLVIAWLQNKKDRKITAVTESPIR
jgi:hypothetical protein